MKSTGYGGAAAAIVLYSYVYDPRDRPAQSSRGRQGVLPMPTNMADSAQQIQSGPGASGGEVLAADFGISPEVQRARELIAGRMEPHEIPSPEVVAVPLARLPPHSKPPLWLTTAVNLQVHYGGRAVACFQSPSGAVAVLADGEEKIGELLKFLSDDEIARIVIKYPPLFRPAGKAGTGSPFEDSPRLEPNRWSPRNVRPQPLQPQKEVQIYLIPRWGADLREDAGLICDLTLRVEARPGRVVPIEFRVDTGASWTMISLAAAQFYGLPIPDDTHNRTLPLNSATERRRVTVRDGRIRVWWDVGGRGTPFDWPVLFVVDAPAGSQPLLGLGGVIRDCRWIFDGRAETDAIFGSATFRDIRFDSST